MAIIELSKEYLIELNEKNIKIEIPEILIKKLLKQRRASKGLTQLYSSLKNIKIDPIEY